jgi:hypothetical protein
MIFTADHHYQITYKNTEAVAFMVMDNSAAFHQKRVFIGDVGKEIFLYELLVKDWESLEEIYVPEHAVSSCSSYLIPTVSGLV